MYVFCLHKHEDQATVNPLLIEQWNFYLMPTTKLNERFKNQKTATLSALVKAGAELCSYEKLAERIHALVRGEWTAFLCLLHRNHCVVTSKWADISARLDIIKTIPKPLANSANLCYNTNNLPRPCITHDPTGGIFDHRTDHRWLWSGRRQSTRECQRAQKPALSRNKNA